MKILRALQRMFTGDPGEPARLEWLPMNGQKLPSTPTVANPRPIPKEPPDWEAKYADAKKRLGKPFAPEIRVPRATEASYQLDYINAQTEIAKRTATITRIDDKRRKS